MIQLADTRILVTIQLVADDSAAADLLYLLAFVATGLIPALASAARLVSYWTGWVEDFCEAVTFTAKVFTIGFKALAYGFVGVRL